MIDLTQDIHSLTDFKRRSSRFVRQLRRTGRPLVLTVNGRAQLVVQDAKSYQRVLALLDQSEAIEGIERGLEDVRRGRMVPAPTALKQMQRKYGIPR